MTDIEQKALALVNEIFAGVGGSPIDYDALVGAGDVVTLALCRAIEQHEAFRQEVSDELIKQGFINASTGIGRFIISKPKPDPLVEALCESGVILAGPVAKDLRTALDALGYEIREKSDG